MTGLATTRYNVLPRCFYKHMNFKPFTCMTCLCFWLGVVMTILFTQSHWALAIPVGLASSALAIITIKLTE
jgi:hypothetical protein